MCQLEAQNAEQELAHQCHYTAYCPFDIDAVISKYSDETGLRSDVGNLNICAVVVHYTSYLFYPFREEPVELSRKDGSVAGDYQLALQGTLSSKSTSTLGIDSPSGQPHSRACPSLSEPRKTLP